jgi:rod shape-determining protein MreC
MATKLQQDGVLAKLASLKGLIQRFTFLSLVLAAFGLMMLGKADTVLVERTRTAIADVAAPILDALSRPAATIEDFIVQVQELAQLREENARLREEVARLRSWHSVANHLAVENQSLRDMLNFVPPPRATFVSARVIADGTGPFSRSLLLNVGSRNGIAKGQAVVDDAGLVGRVTEVGQRSARVLLLTDFNSRVPITFESTRERAILAGDNTATLRLDFVSPTAKVVVGERIVTSGNGGILPAGLPVGTIAGIKDGVPRVQPFVDWSRLEYVRVVDYPPPAIPEFDGAEDSAEQPDAALPVAKAAPVPGVAGANAAPAPARAQAQERPR